MPFFFSPPYFHLIHDTGESYLKSLAYKNDKSGHSVGGERDRSLIDVLIIDAEDGSAPPQSMRTLEFWNTYGSSTPSAGSENASACIGDSWDSCCGPTVGVNAIGSQQEIQDLIQTMRQSFQSLSSVHTDGVYKAYMVLEVSPPPEAEVSERHKLFKERSTGSEQLQ